MAKQLLFLIIGSLFIFSCSKDKLSESLTLEPNSQLVNEPQQQPASDEINDTEPTTLSDFDKSMNWVVQSQLPNGLIQSSENNEFVSLYDNALASIFFIQQGEIAKAEQILDFFGGKIHSELRMGTGGFYQFRDVNGENGSRTWMGDNAWLLIAVNHYHDTFGNQKYDNLASELENWLRTLQNENGSLSGGFNEDGTEISKVSEGMITAFNAVPGYDDFHKHILRYLHEYRWSAQESSIVAWPENPNYNYALDLHTLGYGAFENFPVSTLLKTDRYQNTQVSTVSGNEINGYCFDEDLDVIWLEGTAQLAVAYRLSGNFAKSEELIQELEKAFISSSTSENSKGLPYSTNFGTSFGPSQLWEHADLTPTLSSTVWYLFAKTGFSPLSLGKEKEIPEADQFWLDALN